MSNLQMWSIILGAITPPIVAFVQQPKWKGTLVRPLIMVAFAALDGVIVAWLQGALTWNRFTDSALMCGVAIVAAYEGIWKPSGIAPQIEAATSNRNHPPA
jgi:phage-related minor tail protein